MRPIRRPFLRWMLLSAVMPFLPAAGAARAAVPVTRDVGCALQLFVDDWLIDKMISADLKLHGPAKQDVVFQFDAPWEGNNSAYCTILKDGDKYRMYYRGFGNLDREYTCLAFSDDGIRWTRPSLGLYEVKGSKRNNIILTAEAKAFHESHNFSPFIDQNPAVPRSQRYKAVTVTVAVVPPEKDDRKTLAAFVSEDGIRWNRLRKEPIITDGAFDSHNTVFWDVVQHRYVCYLRAPQAGKKSVARATSPDFLHWTRSEVLDFGGTPVEHFYTNGIVQYPRAPHLYIGLPMRFVHPKERNKIGLEQRKTDGFSDAVFMSSRDGLHWDRPFMEAFIRPGLDPSNWGNAHINNTPVWGILQTGPAEISVYWQEDVKGRPVLRRGTVRLDGFASVNAPYRGGEFVTKPLTFQGGQLVINYATSAVGSMRVEIQDADSRPIPGYTLADCPEFWGDEIERPVAWKAGTDVAKLSGRPVRLRFVMKDADLYTIQFRK